MIHIDAKFPQLPNTILKSLIPKLNTLHLKNNPINLLIPIIKLTQPKLQIINLLINITLQRTTLNATSSNNIFN